jgi:hypothetical protein
MESSTKGKVRQLSAKGLQRQHLGGVITGIGRQRPGLFLDRVYNRLTDGRLTIPNALGLAKKIVSS